MKSPTRACALVLVTLLAAVPLLAQEAEKPPAPGPEHKRLGAFVGAWTMTGTAQPSPFGPGGPMKGTMTCEWFAGGFHLVCDSDETGPMGDAKWHSIMSWDGTAGRYESYGIGSMGFSATETGTVEGDTWSFQGEDTYQGKTMRWRTKMRMVSPDEMAWSGEYTEDGKTWKPSGSGTATRRK